MTKKIAILYASVDGQTKTICHVLHDLFKQQDLESELFAFKEFNNNVLDYHTLIMGASIRYGKHDKLVHEFILNNKLNLNKIQTAFFSVNLVARKKEKNSPDSNPYLLKFIKLINWKPDIIEVFAGKLDYKAYSFFDRLMIKLIMKITDGPTSSDKPIEYTDWNKVKDFGMRLSNSIKSSN